MRFLATETFEGFSGLSVVLLVAGGVAAALWAAVAGLAWMRSRPRMPAPGPESLELGDEPPALANLLVNGWQVTRVAMTATLVDLAARGFLALEDYAGDRHVVRLRSNPPAEPLTGYETQVMDLVRARATDGSAPIETLDLGEESAAGKWWGRFRGEVKREARQKGLAIGRWRVGDLVVLSGGLLVVLELFALALGTAHVGATAEGDGIGLDGWMLIAAAAPVALVIAFVRADALRDTPAGREACTRWLGTRAYLRNGHAFGEATPGSVAIWERNLAYATAFGLAHTVARALPLGPDDPFTAWSRRGGDWHQVRIEYPKRFGFGQPPINVFFAGLGLTAFWGFLGFIVLPTVVRFGWDFRSDVADNLDTSDAAMSAIVLGAALVLFAFGAYVLVNLIIGLVKLARGGLDLRKEVVMEGPVINLYEGRVAIDDGQEETKGWTPPLGTPGLRRGSEVRVGRSPRLWHIRRVEVLSAAAADIEDEEGAATAGLEAVFLGGTAAGEALLAPLTAERITALLGRSFSDGGGGALSRLFDGGDAGELRVTAIPTGGSPIGALVGFAARLRGGSDGLEVAGCKATWAGDRVLTVQAPEHLLVIDADLKFEIPERRLEVARAIADQVLGAAPQPPV